MTEDERYDFDARRMFPEAARRAEILERLKKIWANVVRMPAIARNSRPAVLGVNVLTVEAADDFARGRLAKMKGNIASALKFLGYEAGEDFTVKIVEAVKPSKKISRKKRAAVSVNEERVRQYMSDAPDSLPEDINLAVSHLRAYLEELKR